MSERTSEFASKRTNELSKETVCYAGCFRAPEVNVRGTNMSLQLTARSAGQLRQWADHSIRTVRLGSISTLTARLEVQYRRIWGTRSERFQDLTGSDQIEVHTGTLYSLNVVHCSRSAIYICGGRLEEHVKGRSGTLQWWNYLQKRVCGRLS